MSAAKKYAIIDRYAGKYPITKMCIFFSVSRSGYYKWRIVGKSVDIDVPIGELIGQCQEETDRTYGYRRVKLWLLRKTGQVINNKAVLRIMNKYNLLAETRRPRPLYIRQNQFKKYDNKLKGDLIASKPNQK